MGSITGPRPKTLWFLLVGWVGLLLVGWAAGELAKSTLTAADLGVVRDVAAGRTSALTSLAHAFSFFGSGYWVTPVAVIAFLVLYLSRRRPDAFGVALSVLGASALSASDKLLVERPRPPVEHLEAVSSFSFPSGHSISAGALYVALLIVLLRSRPRRAVAITAGVAAAVMMIGVAISRVYLGVHYPSDVVAGLLLGAGWSLLVGILIPRTPTIHPQFIRRRDDRPMPPGRHHAQSDGRLGRMAVVAAASVLAAALAAASTTSTTGPAAAVARPALVAGAGPNGPQTIAASDFVPHVHNPYFPLRPGTTFHYGGAKDGKPTIDVFHVTGQTKQILGVPCVSIADRL